MTPINFHKKEKPLTSLVSMGGGAAGMANVSGSSAAQYVDEVFSTYVKTGTNASVTINNGIDLGTKEGMVWYKPRNASLNHSIIDTERGVQKYIVANENYVENTASDQLSAFNDNGFTWGDSVGTNDIAWWTFRKNKGFFDVVTYTGDATTRSISHSLGSVPGLILIKDLTSAHDWVVYHRSMGNESFGKLNTNNSFWTGNDIWNSTSPTSTNFTINGNNSFVNTDTNSYVAYVFAGGESTAATARSVELDGDDYLVVADSSNNDFYFGTSDFTIEGWVWPDTYNEIIGAFNQNSPYYGWLVSTNFGGSAGQLSFYQNSAGSGGITQSSGNVTVPKGQWSHFAVTRSGNTFRMFLNGAQVKQWTETAEVGDPNQSIHLGADTNPSPSRIMAGKLSNIRIVKGTAVYTSSFKVPTEPLKNITNTKLLCCNNASVTGSTVAPGAITAVSDPQPSTSNPFDDPDASKYGENEDQSIIKCGSWIGNGDADGPEIYLGWEPQWLLVKNTNLNTEQWWIWDSMRGISTGGSDWSLRASTSSQESTWDLLDLTPTGIKIKSADDKVNNNNGSYVYIAIRRPDGYVGKPTEEATDLFTMVMSNNVVYNSGFPVDFALYRRPTVTEAWWTVGRLIQQKEFRTNGTWAESSWTGAMFDSNVSWGSNVQDNTHQSWMWKRYTSFDVVTYAGNEITGGRQIPHSLSKIPEMIWVFRRNGDDNWAVYHKGLNGGTNPEQYDIHLNLSNGESDNTTWNDTAPTSTYFSVSPNSNEVNADNKDFIAMLFASVDGICKVDSYEGNGQTLSNGKYVNCGFQPRFIILKRADGSGSWYEFDSLRGWGTPGQNTNNLRLNVDAPENGSTFVEPDATGFRVVDDSSQVNGDGNKYIYYAHA